jgi:hypothetical protein
MPTVEQAEQPATVPYDPEMGRWESFKLVPFSKETKLQLRTVRQDGESDADWIYRTANLYRQACRSFGIAGDLLS